MPPPPTPVKSTPPVTSPAVTTSGRVPLSAHRWQTGNATVDDASRQTQAILQQSGQSLQQTWGTARRRAMGKPARIIAIVAIAAITFQTGAFGSFMGFAASFLDDPLDEPTAVLVQAEPVNGTTAGNQAIAAPTAASETGPDSQPHSSQPTIAPNDLSQNPGASWLVIATTGSTLYVNREPNLQFPIQAYPDGTHLEILDNQTIAADGYHWQHVRAPDGVEGWVATEFTVPGDAP